MIQRAPILNHKQETIKQENTISEAIINSFLEWSSSEISATARISPISTVSIKLRLSKTQKYSVIEIGQILSDLCQKTPDHWNDDLGLISIFHSSEANDFIFLVGLHCLKSKFINAAHQIGSKKFLRSCLNKELEPTNIEIGFSQNPIKYIHEILRIETKLRIGGILFQTGSKMLSKKMLFLCDFYTELPPMIFRQFKLRAPKRLAKKEKKSIFRAISRSDLEEKQLKLIFPFIFNFRQL